ncbi:MIP/aquaporin family protein [Aurantimonas sp. VKM B-3413]|uniref:MIP/aquaporin family protein n=1 Tax=Aurantimonas sp. VKM B-3413 TaxID=2779401 RepID=UPI001E400065|nr:aquaporin [Aurantimonas sp. VKM B-3413]MCB8836549.1 aquaporin [Aurantimonas sp. VKM B-3413]
MLRQCIAEAFGTFFMVFVGAGTIALSNLAPSEPMGTVGAGIAFGMAVGTMIYVIGKSSGGHINPAVTVGFFVAKRFPRGSVLPHIGAQCLGAIVGAGVVAVIAHSSPEALARAEAHHFGANGWSWGLTVPWWAAFVAEFVASFAFVSIFLVIRHESRKTPLDGLVIGAAVAALHIAIGPVSGPSLNPARSLGPALFAGVSALSQLWLYILAPLAGGALAGLATRAFMAPEEQSGESGKAD